MAPLPDKLAIRYVIDRAATVRRRRYQDDDHFRHFTEAALIENVCGVEGAVFDLGDGWWQVGIVMDPIAVVELDVLCFPGE